MISVLMPCKGRAQQTVDLIPRLIATAGAVEWELICIVDDDPAVEQALRTAHGDKIGIVALKERHGYWKALAAGTQFARGDMLSNIANDVLPGLRWLERAVTAHAQAFNGDAGVIGYNDGLIFEAHTGHLLVSRILLREWYGDPCWPTMYDHLYGDTEICQRAIIEDRYAVALNAVLFHNHPVVGQTVDGVYKFSHTHMHADEALFNERRQTQWGRHVYA